MPQLGEGFETFFEEEEEEEEEEVGPPPEVVYKAASKMQSIVRMRYALRRVKLLRLRNHRQALMERYSGTGMYRFYFEQQGAALLIQHWYMRSNIRKHWYMKQMLKKYSKVREGKATVIQRQYRGYCDRCKFKRLVFFAQLAADKRTPASKKIQALVRRFLARCRLSAEKFEKLEYVTARHVPSFRTLLTARRRARLATVLMPRDPGFISLNKKQPVIIAAASIPAMHKGAGTRNKRGKSMKAKANPGALGSPKTSLFQIKAPEPVYGNWQRRNAVCFPHFKFATVEALDHALTRVLLIQKIYKRYLSRNYMRASRDTKLFFAAKQIQRWYRCWSYRRLLLGALQFLQPYWKFKMNKWLKRVRATVRIQSHIRRLIVRRMFEKLQYERSCIVKRIQLFVRMRLCHRHVHQRLHTRRTISEDRQAGLSLYKVSHHFLLADRMWAGMKSKKEDKKKSNVHLQSASSHELQTMFGYYGTMGMVDMNRCSKMMKDAKGILEGKIDAMFVELTFTKLKAPGEKRIDFNQFLDLLYCIAVLKYSDIVIKVSDPGPGATIAEKKEQMCIYGKLAGEGGIGSLNEPNEHQLLNSFRFCRLVGIGAYITRLVMECITTLTEYGRAQNALKKRSSIAVVNTEINTAVRKIQRQLRRKVAMLRHVRKKREETARVLTAQRLKGSIVIQSIVRLFIHRRRAVRLAQLLYKKYIDAREKREYWFNPNTKCSFWVKPPLLMHLDCGNAIMLPTPNEEFVVLCNMCLSRCANAYCVECAESMCNQCFETTHKAGKRLTHVMLPQTVCVQCEYQVGCKYCLTCEDAYCDTCFKYMHRKGRLKLHTFKWMCPCCDDCEDRPVQWDRAAPADNYVVSSFCTVCTLKRFGNPKNAKYVTRNVYQDKSVLDYHRAQAEALEKKNAEATYAIRASQNRERKRQRAALTIQRVFRGYRRRCQIAGFIKARHAFNELRELEMPYRESALYIVLAYFGFAPPLKSDTTLERAKKLYPVFMHPVVEACIEHKWSVACDYIRELDKHQHKITKSKADVAAFGVKAGGSTMSEGGSSRGRSSFAFLDGFINAYYVWKTHNAYVKAHKYLEFRKEEHEKKLIAMRNARSDKSLHDIAVMDAAELEQVKADVDEKLEEYNKAQDDYDAFAGPSSLPKLISLRRSNGIKLPFKVNMYKGNTLALTVWPVSAEDGTASPMGGPGSRAVSPVAGEQHQQDSAVVDVKTKRNDGLTKAALDKNAKAGNASGNTVISAATMSTITTAKNKNPKKLNVDVASEMTISPRGDNEFLYFTPGKWRKLLKTGMEVKILGVPFTIVNKHHHVRDYESSVLHDEKTYASSVDVPLSRKKKGKKGAAAAAVIAEEEVLSDDGKSELSANSSIPRTPALGDPTSPGAAGLKSFEVGADDDSMNSDTDSDDDESEKGSRDGELALEKVVDTTEHIRFDRPWILDSREGLEIYKVMPKPFFSRQIYRAERYVQKTYVLQKVCAILAITAHKTGKLNKYLGHFFDEESGIGGWFRDRAKTNYSTRDFWLKRSNTVVEMSFDFSLRRQVTRATIRTLRMVRALARAGVRAVEKFRKEQKKKILSDYDKWMQSADKVTVIVLLQLDKIQPRQNIGDVSLDLEAPADILRTAIQRKLYVELNKTVGDSFLFYHELDNGKEVTLSRAKEAGTYSRDVVPFIMNQKTLIGAATAILVKEGDLPPKPIAKWVDPLASVKVKKIDGDKGSAGGDDGSMSSAGGSSVLS